MYFPNKNIFLSDISQGQQSFSRKRLQCVYVYVYKAPRGFMKPCKEDFSHTVEASKSLQKLCIDRRSYIHIYSLVFLLIYMGDHPQSLFIEGVLHIKRGFYKATACFTRAFVKPLGILQWGLHYGALQSLSELQYGGFTARLCYEASKAL